MTPHSSNGIGLRRILAALGLAAASLVVAGCGDDNSITDPNPDTGNTAGVASIELLTSNVQVPSDGSVEPEIIALVRDSNNNVVEGATVFFRSDSGALQVTQPTTDATGVAKASLGVGGDRSNRMISVTGQINNLSSNVAVEVVGTTLNIVGPPSLVQGALDTYTVRLSDSSGQGVTGQAVTVTASPELQATVAGSGLTNSAGEVAVEVTGVAGGTGTLQADALNLVAVQSVSVSNDSFEFSQPAADAEIPLNTDQAITLSWQQNGVPVAGQTVNFSTTRGTLSSATAVTDGSGQATVTVNSANAGSAVLRADVAGGPSASTTVEFVATAPASMDLQASPFTLGPGETSTITATVRDANQNLVKNQVVEFLLDDITGGTISVQSDTTDSQGKAQTVYTASPQTSASGGVTITGSVRGANPPVQASVNVTVARKELFITIGSDNQIEKLTAQARYRKRFAVQVTDSEGGGVSGVTVQLGILSESYAKGQWIIVNPDDEEWTQIIAATCPDEDTNRNGILDPGEDFNGNGTLDAGNVALVTPANVVTDESGFVAVDVFYPQEFARWVNVTLSATATVQGTEAVETNNFTLPILLDDVKTNTSPPGQTSPFGTAGTCSDPS
jgi:hypothetical protein